MELSQKQNVHIIAALLLLAVITQLVYTLMYVAASDVPRLWLWSLEGLLFVLLAAISGSAMVLAKQNTLGFSAIFASAILNVVQVGIGLTQFGAFREAAQGVEALAPAAGSVVALSFFIYNAAKILLGISALVFGSAIARAGSKWLGKLTIFIALVAIATNTIAMMFGRIEAVPSGATGVVATLLLALCLFKLQSKD
jgi:hypothetical protein